MIIGRHPKGPEETVPQQKRLLSLFAISSMFVTPVFAADAPQADRLAECAAINDNAARLACFDATMAGRSGAVEETAPESVENGELAASAAPAPAVAPPAPSEDYVLLPKADAEELAELRRKAGVKEREESREAYESKIVRVFTTGYKVRNVELENGETWRELAAAVGAKPRRGESARLAPGMLGSWTVQYGERSSKFKVKRVR